MRDPERPRSRATPIRATPIQGDAPQREAARRRTFAIISHPDAGKTTITEKFLLYGGVLNAGAGAVKAKAGQRNATSDWMELERRRGISITSTVPSSIPRAGVELARHSRAP